MYGFDVHTETEAAIWAEGTQYTKEDILRAYREHIEMLTEDGRADESPTIQSFCEVNLQIAN